MLWIWSCFERCRCRLRYRQRIRRVAHAVLIEWIEHSGKQLPTCLVRPRRLRYLRTTRRQVGGLLHSVDVLELHVGVAAIVNFSTAETCKLSAAKASTYELEYG